MQESIETIEYRGYHINIGYDDYTDSPRVWDNLGTMAYKHSQYILGDEKMSDSVDWLTDKLNLTYDQVDRIAGDLDSSVHSDEVLSELLDRFSKEYIFLPLYLYDHSGLTMNTTGFSCRWDSGQVGIIYVSRSKVREEYSWKKLTKAREDKIREYLKAEVEIFDQYLTGEVYCYDIDEINESCCGFYGDYGKEDMITQAKNAIDWEINDIRKKYWQQLKTWIKNGVPFQYRTPMDEFMSEVKCST